MAFSRQLPPRKLLFGLLFPLFLPGLLSSNASKSERCSDGRTARLCRITPLGVLQGKQTYDPYETLGVSSTAPLESIQQAYRLKARACHPDKFRLSCASKKEPETKGDNPQVQEDEPFVIINAAYEMLRKPENRKLFDRNGSGDGGRFVRRGSATRILKSSFRDIFEVFAESLNFNADSPDDDEVEEDEEEDYPEFGIFGQDDDDEEDEGEGEEGFDFEWDFSDISDIF